MYISGGVCIENRTSEWGSKMALRTKPDKGGWGGRKMAQNSGRPKCIAPYIMMLFSHIESHISMCMFNSDGSLGSTQNCSLVKENVNEYYMY